MNLESRKLDSTYLLIYNFTNTAISLKINVKRRIIDPVKFFCQKSMPEQGLD